MKIGFNPFEAFLRDILVLAMKANGGYSSVFDLKIVKPQFPHVNLFP